jgi:hypothetical protein
METGKILADKTEVCKPTETKTKLDKNGEVVTCNISVAQFRPDKCGTCSVCKSSWQVEKE